MGGRPHRRDQELRPRRTDLGDAGGPARGWHTRRRCRLRARPGPPLVGPGRRRRVGRRRARRHAADRGVRHLADRRCLGVRQRPRRVGRRRPGGRLCRAARQGVAHARLWRLLVPSAGGRRRGRHRTRGGAGAVGRGRADPRGARGWRPHHGPRRWPMRRTDRRGDDERSPARRDPRAAGWIPMTMPNPTAGLSRVQARRLIARALLLSLLPTLVLIALYSWLPLKALSDAPLWLILLVGGTVLLVVGYLEVHGILKASYPGIRAVQ